MTSDSGTLESFLKKASAYLSEQGRFQQEYSQIQAILQTLREPFSIAVVGRMKAGKSTLINSLIGRKLAISDVEEATATLNWICHGSGEQTRQFVAHWKDGRSEPFPIERVADWTGKSPEVLERVRRTSRLMFFSEDEFLKEIQVIDTPGTGSAVNEHEIAREFLNPDVIDGSIKAGGRADAIVYVVPPVGKESDKETLELFTSGCIANSSPYNSVCVLHKWDALESELSDDPSEAAKLKAEKLFSQISDNVMGVIPVSAPLALTAKTAPDSFFYDLIESCQMPDKDFHSALKYDERWDRDPKRAEKRKSFDLPWASFRLILILLRKHQISSADEARKLCFFKSGLGNLENFLRDRIFSKTGIIKQFQCLRRAESVLQPVILKAQAQCEKWKADSTLARQSSDCLLGQRPDLAKWLRVEGDRYAKLHEIGMVKLLELDREWNVQKDNITALSMDLELMQNFDLLPAIRPSDRNIIETICDHLSSPERKAQLGGMSLPSLQTVAELLNYYQMQANKAPKKQQRYYEHITDRLQQVWQRIEASIF
jgi:GTPase Era involved in 16S rRNA processing